MIGQILLDYKNIIQFSRLEVDHSFSVPGVKPGNGGNSRVCRDFDSHSRVCIPRRAQQTPGENVDIFMLSNGFWNKGNCKEKHPNRKNFRLRRAITPMFIRLEFQIPFPPFPGVQPETIPFPGVHSRVCKKVRGNYDSLVPSQSTSCRASLLTF